ncbi:Kinase A inhibitor [Polaribacter huanghezhanensis]|uniref:5-oxoprolinase subunit PxpB n=1 Tax=Polaribacter huanghezhanensis TaxID=1354726 RepID=UPI0026478732|nr:5-oxoprolinase subunit PxpB [Polaribacter huanghezhanensis]WKD85915.1 Kinase A inhibitor [Polaribacter huanghezhanensis]
MPNFQLSYKIFGEKAILIEWPSEISEIILKDILNFKSNIDKKIELKDCIIGYNSILLVYNFVLQNTATKIEFLKKLYRQKSIAEKQKITHWKIPVCYDKQFGIDLDEISKIIKISSEEIIQLHTKGIYTVYFIGFLPGFLYLGGLDDQIAIPRKATPRLHVPKGAVAIGGNQTGVYSNQSSGGWNIIGNSPVSFFDVQNQYPCFAKTGDKITFENISLEEYNHIKDNNYQIEKIL